MNPVVPFPHDVIASVSMVAVEATTNKDGEVIVPIDLDQPNPQEAAGQDQQAPSTSGSQVPLTDPASVATSGAKCKEKVKGRNAKRACHNEKVTSTNTALVYLDLENEENTPVSKSEIPGYLLKPAPSTIGVDKLRKHAIISDIEKNRAVTRMAEKIITLVPALQSFLRSIDPTEQNRDATDHSYQTSDA